MACSEGHLPNTLFFISCILQVLLFCSTALEFPLLHALKKSFSFFYFLRHLYVIFPPPKIPKAVHILVSIVPSSFSPSHRRGSWWFFVRREGHTSPLFYWMLLILMYSVHFWTCPTVLGALVVLSQPWWGNSCQRCKSNMTEHSVLPWVTKAELLIHLKTRASLVKGDLKPEEVQ